MTDRLREILVTAANPNGGWPYYAGKSSRIEPTCWALMASAEAADEPAEWSRLALPHLRWLARTQRADGLLVDAPDAPANFTSNGLAACVLAHFEQVRLKADATDLRRLVGGIINTKGISVKDPDPRQDNSLQGWPWFPDTFSWLEPTAWCTLALKKAGARDTGAAARIQEADRLILNRTCESGGWNFGNASVMGQDLRPYVPTTALALIALQDHTAAAEVVRSADWLRQARLKEPSAMALALTSIWLQLSGQPAEDVDARLIADLDRAERVGNLQALAMMLYALTSDRHGARSLRIGVA